MRVVFYAGAAALAGCRQVLVEVERGEIDRDGVGLTGRPGGEAGVPPCWLRHRLRERFPRLARLLDVCQLAVNGRFVREEEMRLRPGDEVAVLPPASGGSGEGETGPCGPGDEGPEWAGTAEGPPGRVRLAEDRLSVDEVLGLVAHEDAGAVVLFVGTVRRRTDSRVTESLYYEAHPTLAREGLEAIVGEAEGRWPGVRLAVAHRLGLLRPGEASVAVAAAAPHRDEAFAACRYAIEEIKRRVPIWKEERGPRGSFWVHAVPDQVPRGGGAADSGGGGTDSGERGAGAGHGGEAGGLALAG